VYSYVDITSYVLLANLPADVVRILPWTGVVNGPTGAAPEGFTDWFLNRLVEVGQLLYKGLVALVTFLADLAAAVADWGMKFFGSVSQAVDQAVEKVGLLLDELAKLIVDGIKTLFASIHAQLKAIWDASVGAYLAGIEAALALAVEEYERLGQITAATAEQLRAAVTAPLFWAVLGIAVAVVAGYVAYAASTLGIGVLVAGVGITIALALASQVFGLGLEDIALNVAWNLGQSMSQLIASFLDWAGSVAAVDPELRAMLSTVLGITFGTGSLIANLVSVSALDAIASTPTALGLFFSIISLPLSIAGVGGGVIGRAFSFVGALFGFAGAALSVVGQVKSGGLFKPVNIAGTAMGVTGAYLGVTN
jgi:hypothetical protein